MQLLEDRTLPSAFYDLTTLASTMSGTFTSFGDLVSVNHAGDVAFVGATGSGVYGDSGLYVERAGTAPPVNINPNFSSDPIRSFGQAAAINDDDIVTARDEVASDPTQFLVRQWDGTRPDSNVILSRIPPTGTGSPDSQYSALQTFTDINDEQDVVFVAQSADGSSRSVEFVSHNNVGLDTYQTIETMPGAGQPSPKPQLTDTGQILYYSTADQAIKLVDPSTGNVSVIASVGNGEFASLGGAPGVSADGRVVVFTGTDSSGISGVYAEYLTGGAWSSPVRIAGGGQDGFTSFDPTSAVQVEGSLSDGERGMTVAFVGTHTGTPTVPAERQGLYTCRLSFFGKSTANYDPDNVQSVLVNGVVQVAKIGDTLPDGNTITKIVFWHGIDWRNRGTLTFWVQTNAGQEIVQAKPWQLVWLDFDPTTSTPTSISQSNSALLAKVGITDSGWGGSTPMALVALGLPQNYDFNALETAVAAEVQDQFQSAGARVKVTASQPDDIPEPGIDSAGNAVLHQAYKTVYIGGAPTPAPDVLGKASAVDFFNQVEDDTAVVFVDMVVKSSGFGGQPASSQTYLVNGLADTIAHEAGHTFGLYHLDPSRSTQLMHGGTDPKEFSVEQTFSANAYPTYFNNVVHPEIVESSAARLQFATGILGSPITGQNVLPDPALLAHAAGATNKAEITFVPATSLNVADLLVGVVAAADDTLPSFQDLGGGDLATLLNNANILLSPGDSLLVIGSTDGKAPDVVAVAQGQQAAQGSLSPTFLGLIDDSRLQAPVSGNAAGFQLYLLAASGATDLGTAAIQLSSPNPAPTIALTASTSAPIAGQPLTITANVAPVDTGGTTPTGTIQFQVDGTNLGTPVALDSNGMARSPNFALAVGAHTVSAVYSGDSTYASLSKSLILVASAPPSATVALSAGNSSPIANQPLAFTALVTPPALGDPTPTGTVQFQVDGVNVGTPVPLANGAATSGGIALAAGSHTITAVYSGDESYGQTPRLLTLTAAIPTATMVLMTGGSITLAGQPVTFTATMTTSPSGANTPTGTVQFKVDGTALGAAVTLVNGTANSGSVTLTAGSHTVTAVYSGDSTYTGVNSSLTVTATAPASFAVGSFDPTFGSQGVVPLVDPQGMAIDPEGRILIPGAYGIGSFDFSQFALWRYTADGQPDRSFGSNGAIQFPGGRQYGVGVAVEPDGKLVGLVSGDSIALVRFYDDGSVDTTFGTNGLLQPPSFTVNGNSAAFIAGEVYSTTGVRIATLPDGRILLAGTIAPSSSTDFVGYALAMFLPNGQLDTSFNGTGTLVVTALPPIVQGLAISDGSILVMSSAWQGAENIAVSAYRFDGTPVSNFGVNGTVAPTLVGAVEGFDLPTMAVQSDGKVLIGYLNDSVNLNSGTETILRYNADGSTDTAFGSGGTTSAGSNLSSSSNIAVEPDGKILIAVGSQLALLRVNPDGTLDTSFGTGGLDTIALPSNPNANFSQIAVQPSGRIVALTHNNGVGAFGPHNDLLLIGVIGDPVVAFGATTVSSNSGKPTAEYDVMETSGSATITLVRHGDLSQPLSVPFSTDDSGGRGGVDYTPVSTTVTFTAGSAIATITIPILIDPNASGAVDIPLRLGTPSGGAVLGAVSVGDLHIVPVEGITVAPSQLSSVMQGGPTSSFTVVLTSVPTGNVTVPLAISNTNPAAILSTNALVFTPANALLPQTVTVTATGGTGTSPTLATVTAGPATSTDPKYNGLAGGSAKVTVYPRSSSSPGAIEFSTANYTVNEGAGAATITLVRLGGSQGTVSVSFATSDGSSQASGKYTPLSGSISFGPGVTTRQFSIALINPGRNLQGDQTVDLVLSSPSGGATLGAYAAATLTLHDPSQIAAGDLDPAFGANGVSILPAGGGVSSSTGPSVIALQPDGKIVAAGTATSGSGGSLVSVWRTDALGHLDASFGQQGAALVPFPNFTQIAGIAITPDGKIVIAGTASGVSTSELALLRLNTDGSLDTTFGSNGLVKVSVSPGNDAAQALAVESDGSILVAGSIAPASGGAVLGLVHFSADGSLDIGFGTAGVISFPTVGSGLSAMLQQPNGQWLLVGGGGAGDLFDGGSATPGFAVRLNSDFGIDTTFGTQGIASLSWGEFYTSVTLQPDGKIIVGGSEGPLGGGHGTIGRLNPDGSLDASFGQQGSVSATFSNSASGFNSVFVQPDGRIVGVGYTAGAGGNAGSGNYVVSARYLADGSVDPSFASGGTLQYALSGDASDSPGTAVALPNGDLVVTIQSDGLPMLAAELPETPPSAPVLGQHPGQLSFATSAAAVNAGGTAMVTVDRFGGSDGTVSVAYALQGNTAVAGTDYTAASGTLTFGPGVTWQILPIPTFFDPNASGDLSLDVVLSAPNGGASLSTSDTFALTIVPLAQPAFSSLDAPTIAYGTASTTLSGQISAGTSIPSGSVTISVNSVNEDAAIDPSTGAFSAVFATAALGVAESPYTITYNFAGDANFAPISSTTTLIVNQATPTITWANPVDITEGTALGSSQLDATASVAGSFVYSPAAGTVLSAGVGQTLSVTFTPTDSTDYNSVDATATISVDSVTAPGIPNAPVLSASSDTGVSSTDGITRDNGSSSAPLTFTIDGVSPANGYVQLYDDTDPANPVPLGTPVQAAGGSATVTLQGGAGLPLADGAYAIAAASESTSGGTPSALSPTMSITIQSSLRVISITPSGPFYTSLPNLQVVVTFNHLIAGLVADRADGTGLASSPFAVMLIPAGPDGLATARATGSLWSGPSGVDSGDLPIPATGVYHVNGDGTSTITLTPHSPLATDIYLISVNNVTDLAGNPVSNGAGRVGSAYSSFEYRPYSPQGAPTVVSVTTQGGTVVINNNQISQPDTIGIRFSKPMDPYTINANTVQLFQQGVASPLQTAVFYSPSTQSAYLTPETKLAPGVTYSVSVSTGVADDSGFPNPGFSLAHAIVTSFTVAGGSVGTGASPLSVLHTGPANGTMWSAPLGYGTVTFNEALSANLSQSMMTRYSAMLIPQTGSATRGANTFADVPVNAKLAFNPNTNQLIIVPTEALRNDTIYLFSLSGIKASSGDALAGTTFATFLYNSSGAQSFAITRPSTNDTAVTSSEPVPAGPAGVGHDRAASAWRHVPPRDRLPLLNRVRPQQETPFASSRHRHAAPRLLVRPIRAPR